MGTPIRDEDTAATLRKKDWSDTGFTLAWEIGESESVRNFFVICNLHNELDDLSDDDKGGEPWRLRLCGREPGFTVAHVVKQSVDLIKDSWEEACKREEMTLEILSNLRPDIVQTGLTPGPNERLVGLFPSKQAEST